MVISMSGTLLSHVARNQSAYPISSASPIPVCHTPAHPSTTLSCCCCGVCTIKQSGRSKRMLTIPPEYAAQETPKHRTEMSRGAEPVSTMIHRNDLQRMVKDAKDGVAQQPSTAPAGDSGVTQAQLDKFVADVEGVFRQMSEEIKRLEAVASNLQKEVDRLKQNQQPGGYGPQQGGYPPQQGGYPPQQGGYGPQQGGYGPQQGGYPPQQGGYGPQQGGYGPQQGGYGPQQGGYPPQQGGYGPQQGGYGPQQGGYGPK